MMRTLSQYHVPKTGTRGARRAHGVWRRSTLAYLHYNLSIESPMSVAEQTRRLSKDLLALELRELSARIDALEWRMANPIGKADDPATKRHAQLMQALAKLADLHGLRERVIRIEARERAS